MFSTGSFFTIVCAVFGICQTPHWLKVRIVVPVKEV